MGKEIDREELALQWFSNGYSYNPEPIIAYLKKHMDIATMTPTLVLSERHVRLVMLYVSTFA